MKNAIQILIFLVFPLGAYAQWNPNLSVNLPIASGGVAPGNSYNLYSNNGYFFCYDENVEYKIHRYNTDGTPNWASAMLPNNRTVGTATFQKYAFIDNTGNLIHISSFHAASGAIHFCINKITPSGTQLWNGSLGIDIDAFVIGAYLSPNNDLYIAKENNTLQKYNAMGVLQWTSSFAASTFDVGYVNIAEKADSTLGLVFFKFSPFNPTYGNYYYTGISNNGTFINNVQIETEACRFFTPYKLLTDNNDLYFLFTDQYDKGHVQKISSNAPVYPLNGFDIDVSTAHASIYESAIIKDGELNILYSYYELMNGPNGILNQKIDLASFTRSFANGNILIDCNSNDVITTDNGMISHDSNFGFLVLDKITNNLSYIIFDGNAIIQSQNVCTTSSEKGVGQLSSLNNINSTNSQVVVLFSDVRNPDFSYELYAQNILYGWLGVDNETEISSEVGIYPNPTSSILFIKSNLPIKNIEIYNSLGQLVSSISNADKIDLTNLQFGAYIVKIKTENNQTFFKKIIKE